MRKPRGKILIIRGGAIGDFILTLPVFSALRHHFPDTQVEVLGYPHIAQLALAGGLVDAVRSIEARALASFFSRHPAAPGEFDRYFAEFGVVISYLYDPDQFFESNLRRVTQAQLIAGPHRPEETRNIPAAEVLLRPLERLAIFGADPIPKLSVRNESQITLPESCWIAIHPGLGSPRKNWAESHWVELAKRILGRPDFRLLLVGGEAEGELLSRLVGNFPPDRVQCAQDLPLTQVAGLLSQCNFFLGHDSGISHLAAALGLRGLLLWKESNEAIWRPPSSGMTILKMGAEDWPVDLVWAKTRELLEAHLPRGGH